MQLFNINLSDCSVLVVDQDFVLPLRHKRNFFKKKEVPILKYLDCSWRYKNYRLCDLIEDQYKQLSFTIEPTFDTDIKPGERYKLAKHIFRGDQLIGPDGYPRTVQETHFGIDNLYKITDEDGNSHEVNSTHQLWLYNIETSEEFAITVQDFILMPEEFKKVMRLKRID